MVRGQKGAGMLKPLKASDVISAYKDTGSMRGAEAAAPCGDAPRRLRDAGGI